MTLSETLPPDAETALSAALLAGLRADTRLQALLGSPPRLFDGETEAPAYPFALLERHEVTPSDASGVAGLEHRLTLSVRTRESGRAGAMAALGDLRAAVETLDLHLSGQRVVLLHVVYADVLRTQDLRAFRGLLRVRAVTEAVAEAEA